MAFRTTQLLLCSIHSTFRKLEKTQMRIVMLFFLTLEKTIFSSDSR